MVKGYRIKKLKTLVREFGRPIGYYQVYYGKRKLGLPTYGMSSAKSYISMDKLLRKLSREDKLRKVL